ncbi:NAD-P-binding protein [Ganoderma leucocontextum]|nr:NAD-P-binding protein [Ganoderma leucocontextum]
MGASFSRRFNPAADIPDLSGKVILVTGGNAGIGFAVIQQLVRHGAKVYMGARNQEKARAAIERSHASGISTDNGQVVWLDVDLSDPRKIQNAAEEVIQREERLDVLINNAAVLLVPFAKDYDNIQNIVMTNYIGAYLLTRALLPLLKRTAQEPNSDVRIVSVNSARHHSCPADVRFRDIDDFNRDFEDTMFPQLLRYAMTKTMQLMFAKDLQRRLDDEALPILCMAVDPGEVNTEGVHAYTESVGPILGPLYRAIAYLTFTSPANGALGPLFCAASPIPRAQPTLYRGAYLDPPGKLSRCSELAERRELAAELWDTTERILNEIGIELPAV